MKQSKKLQDFFFLLVFLCCNKKGLLCVFLAVSALLHSQYAVNRDACSSSTFAPFIEENNPTLISWGLSFLEIAAVYLICLACCSYILSYRSSYQLLV